MSCNNGRLRRISSWTWGEDSEGEKKAKVLNAFFPSVFTSKINCSLVPSTLLELEGKDREQKEALIIREQMVSNLPQNLDAHKFMLPDGIHTRVLTKPADMLTMSLSIISAVLAISAILEVLS